MNPFVEPYDARVLRMERKINAGAQFFQTQFWFDLPVLERFMEQVRARGLHKKCYILVGVGPLISVGVAKFMKAHVPGVVIPDALIRRLDEAADERAESKKICIEILDRVRQIEGISGVHIMSYRHERLLAEIITDAGLGRPA